MTNRWLFSIVLAAFLTGVWSLEGHAQSDLVREVQSRLSERGFDPGPADGYMGPRTRSAIRDFQRANNLTVHGNLDGPTRKALGIEDETVRVPAGTRIQVHLNDRLDSANARENDRFTMTVSQAVAAEGAEAIPAGAVLTGRVVEAESARRPQRGGRLVLEVVGIRVEGINEGLSGFVTAETDSLEGEGSLTQDIKKIGAGAAVGGVIGAIAGGRRGALIGVLVGGGGTFAATRGEQVELPPETRLIVELTQEVVLPRVR